MQTRSISGAALCAGILTFTANASITAGLMSGGDA
jgi:hypothetical protein